MKNRKEKIKEIEKLIEKNKSSRRKFISSLVKTAALGAMAAMGISSLLSCEKEYLEENNSTSKKLTVMTVQILHVKLLLLNV